jgi:hypothetical protein
MSGRHSHQGERSAADDLEARLVRQCAELMRKDEVICTQQKTIRNLAAKLTTTAEPSEVGSPVSPNSNGPLWRRNSPTSFTPRRSQQKQFDHAPHSTAKKSNKKALHVVEHDALRYSRDALSVYDSRVRLDSSNTRADYADLRGEYGRLRTKYESLRERHAELKTELRAYSHAAAENSQRVELLSAARVSDCATIARLNLRLREYEQLENDLKGNDRLRYLHEQRSFPFSLVRLGGAEKPPSTTAQDVPPQNLVDENLANADVGRLRDELMAVVNENGTISKRNSDLEAVFVDLSSEIHVLSRFIQSLCFGTDSDAISSQEDTITVSSDRTQGAPYLPIRDFGAVYGYSVSGQVPNRIREQHGTGHSTSAGNKASLEELVDLVKKARRDVALKYGAYLACASGDRSPVLARIAQHHVQSSRESSFSIDERSGTSQLSASIDKT